MNAANFRTPAEITEWTIQTGIQKSKAPAIHLVLLGLLAGAFIAFASEGSTMAAFNWLAQPETYGLGRALAGAIFGTGLMLVVIAGGELFTGNTLMLASVLTRTVTIRAMLRNWLLVYIGNFAGSVLIAWMMSASGLFSSGVDLLGAVTIKTAVYKIGLSFGQAFLLGVMCNWLVCLAIWMANGAKDITGKILAIFFPIWLFITSGFEHSVANMYYIPAALFAKNNPDWVAAAADLGVTERLLGQLTWRSMLLNNLLPVTLGNIVGGGVLVGMVYAFIYARNKQTSSSN